jgi:hypothetical protein
MGLFAVLNSEVLKYIFQLASGHRRVAYSGSAELDVADFATLARLARVNRHFHAMATSIPLTWPPRQHPRTPGFADLELRRQAYGIDFGQFRTVAQMILAQYPPDEWIYAPVGSSPLPVTVFMALLDARATICHVVLSGRRRDPDLGELTPGQHTRRTPRPPLNQFIFGRFLPAEKIDLVLKGQQKVLVIDWSHGATLGLVCNYLYAFLHHQNGAVGRDRVVGLTLDAGFPYPRDRFYAFKLAHRGEASSTPRAFFHGFHLRPLARDEAHEQVALAYVSRLLHDEKIKKLGARGVRKLYPADYVRAFNRELGQRAVDDGFDLQAIYWLAVSYFALAPR